MGKKKGQWGACVWKVSSGATASMIYCKYKAKKDGQARHIDQVLAAGEADINLPVFYYVDKILSINITINITMSLSARTSWPVREAGRTAVCYIGKKTGVLGSYSGIIDYYTKILHVYLTCTRKTYTCLSSFYTQAEEGELEYSSSHTLLLQVCLLQNKARNTNNNNRPLSAIMMIILDSCNVLETPSLQQQ